MKKLIFILLFFPSCATTYDNATIECIKECRASGMRLYKAEGDFCVCAETERVWGHEL